MQKIIFVRMRKVYLLTTAHLEDHLWFREEEDFRVGMNYVAIESARQLRLRFSADANQIARVCGLTYADAARLLDRF